jgi:hypothetical protein
MKRFIVSAAAALVLTACAHQDAKVPAGDALTPDEQRAADEVFVQPEGPLAPDHEIEPPTTAVSRNHGPNDRAIAATIRRGLMETALSTAAKNVQIVSHQGRVTLKGNVESNAEAAQVAEMARDSPGVVAVDDQLQITAH